MVVFSQNLSGHLSRRRRSSVSAPRARAVFVPGVRVALVRAFGRRQLLGARTSRMFLGPPGADDLGSLGHPAGVPVTWLAWAALRDLRDPGRSAPHGVGSVRAYAAALIVVWRRVGDGSRAGRRDFRASLLAHFRWVKLSHRIVQAVPGEVVGGAPHAWATNCIAGPTTFGPLNEHLDVGVGHARRRGGGFPRPVPDGRSCTLSMARAALFEASCSRAGHDSSLTHPDVAGRRIVPAPSNCRLTGILTGIWALVSSLPSYLPRLGAFGLTVCLKQVPRFEEGGWPPRPSELVSTLTRTRECLVATWRNASGSGRCAAAPTCVQLWLRLDVIRGASASAVRRRSTRSSGSAAPLSRLAQRPVHQRPGQVSVDWWRNLGDLGPFADAGEVSSAGNFDDDRLMADRGAVAVHRLRPSAHG